MAVDASPPSSDLSPGPADERRAATVRWWSRWVELFDLDLRSLAVFRFSLGVIILCDLMDRATDLAAHYSDAGILPRSIIGTGWTISLHMLEGSVWFQALLFGMAGLFAVMLAIGWQTRLATLVSCLLLISVQTRNPPVCSCADVVLRLLLFWGIFLPLGARWSVDAWRSGGDDGPPPVRVRSMAAAALLLQVCFVYWFSIAFKAHPVWFVEGTAVRDALLIDQMVTPIGAWLRHWPEVTRLLTYATLAIEALGPVLLFIPYRQGPIRFGVVILFVLFHVLGLGLCIYLGIFPFVSAISWLCLLPSWFWDRLVFQRGSEATESVPPLSAPWPINALVALLLAYVFLWNVRSIDYARFRRLLPESTNFIGNAFGLDQRWAMFAPYPWRNDGWLVARAELRDGRVVDLLRGGREFSWDKPTPVAALYHNERTRKYLECLTQPDHQDKVPPLAAYLRRRWDEGRPQGERVARIQIIYMLEQTLPDGSEADPEPHLLYEFPENDPSLDLRIDPLD